MAHGLVLVHVEGLASRIDGGDTLAGEHVDELAVHGAHAGHELAELTLGVGLVRVVKGALHVVDDGQELGHQRLGRTRAFAFALASRALAIVVPLGLEAQVAVVGRGGLGARLLQVGQ